MVDVDEIIRATGYLKTSEKPWEIRWDENEQVITHPNLGYFDNRKFNPGKWKSNLFHVTFNYLTEADGYWAAKIISTFTDEDIKAVVRTGGLSDPEAERLLTKILIDRRDMIIHYWFNKVSPLENFEIQEGSSGLELQFDDWGVEKAGVTNRTYSYEAFTVNGKKKKLLTKGESQEPTLTIPTASSEKVLVEVSTHKGDKKNRPVKVTFDPRAPFSILSIEH